MAKQSAIARQIAAERDGRLKKGGGLESAIEKLLAAELACRMS